MRVLSLQQKMLTKNTFKGTFDFYFAKFCRFQTYCAKLFVDDAQFIFQGAHESPQPSIVWRNIDKFVDKVYIVCM